MSRLTSLFPLLGDQAVAGVSWFLTEVSRRASFPPGRTLRRRTRIVSPDRSPRCRRHPPGSFRPHDSFDQTTLLLEDILVENHERVQGLVLR
jgi:hypothetical protein